MDLPILKTSAVASADSLVRYFHQTESQWTQHVSENTLLDFGVAHVNSKLPRVYYANRLMDVSLPAGLAPADAYAFTQSHFAAIGSACWQWMMNPSSPAAQTAPMAEYLLGRGYLARSHDIMHLPRVNSLSASNDPSLKIIPARASFKHSEAIHLEASRRWNEPQLAEAAMLHLDDPHYDAQLALKHGRPVAFAGVLAAGEIGRIDEVYVSESDRRRGLGAAILSRVLESCARSLFKHVLLCVAPDNSAAISLYSKFGFRKVGQMSTYQKPAP